MRMSECAKREEKSNALAAYGGGGRSSHVSVPEQRHFGKSGTARAPSEGGLPYEARQSFVVQFRHSRDKHAPAPVTSVVQTPQPSRSSPSLPPNFFITRASTSRPSLASASANTRVVIPSAEVNLTAFRITSRFESCVALGAEAELETGRAGALAKRGGSAGIAEGNKPEVLVRVDEDEPELRVEGTSVLAAEEDADAAYGCPAYDTACPAKGGRFELFVGAAPPAGAGTDELFAFRCPLP